MEIERTDVLFKAASERAQLLRASQTLHASAADANELASRVLRARESTQLQAQRLEMADALEQPSLGLS